MTGNKKGQMLSCFLFGFGLGLGLGFICTRFTWKRTEHCEGGGQGLKDKEALMN